jgi:hypothetical protein
MSDLVVVEAEAQAVSKSLMDYKPKEMVAAATEIANVLKDVIDKQKLFVSLNGNQHVKAEGWSVLGTMLSILPKEEKVIRHEDGSFEAYVCLINNRNGHVVGGGSGFVGMDEPNWKKKPDYARRSMAITRATSKAYKTCFSWIIALAGYNATPAEEMDFLTTEKQAPKEETKVKTALVYDGSEDQKKSLSKIFTTHNVEGDHRKIISDALIQWKVPFEQPYMSEGVLTALKQLSETGKIDCIPF